MGSYSDLILDSETCLVFGDTDRKPRVYCFEVLSGSWVLQLTRVRFAHRVLLLLDFFCFSVSASYLVTFAEGVLSEKGLRNDQHAEEQRLALYVQYGMVSKCESDLVFLQQNPQTETKRE